MHYCCIRFIFIGTKRLSFDAFWHSIPVCLSQSENLHASLLHQIHIHREQRGSHLMPPGILSLCLGERAVYAKCKESWLKEYSSQHMTMNACPVDYKLILLVPKITKKGCSHKKEDAHIYGSCTFMGGKRQKGKGLFFHAIQYCIP